ncbi:MAG: hypothetical protein OEZ28_13735 [Nitrospinota bacterium]|nr:hypothetical protein [Nitrospinota bacterium]
MSDQARTRHRADNMITALIGVPATMITAGVCLVIMGLSTYPPLEGTRVLNMALIYGGILAMVYIALGLYMLRQRGARAGIMAIFFAVSLCGVPALALGSILAANGALDASPPNILGAMVMDKETVAHPSERFFRGSHALHVRSWRATGQQEKLYVEKEFHDQATPFKDTIVVKTKSGLFGFEWIVSLEMAP